MDKHKILNQIKDGHRFLEMLEQKFPKARNNVINISWVLNSIKEEINKPDTPVVPVASKTTEKIEEKQ